MPKLNYHPNTVVRWKLASCAGKEAYSDGGKANRALSHMKRSGSRVMTYRCSHCGQWHIGGGK